jgi:alpha-L-fucosidase
LSQSFEPTLESIRRHPVPDWYHDAKLGIFVHWSLASIPAFAPREHEINELLRTRYDDMQVHVPYSEWYENSLRFPDSPVSRHHHEVHGDRPYSDFKEAYVNGLEQWRPDEWAERFARAGARYVVLVTKHHDGFCLWPSKVANPHREGWYTERDCVGELCEAVRARGMRFGVYYSGGLDWTFDAHPIANMGDLAAAMPMGDYPAYADAQMRELIERYRPDVLWNDIFWPQDQQGFVRLVSDYYNAIPEGVINDRWITASWAMRAMRLRPLRALANALIKRQVQHPDANITPPPSAHFDARTPEYAVFPDVRAEKWECVRGMDKSFGYNRASEPDDFIGHEDLIHSLADITSKNGNLLINVGPRGEDAQIPDIQLQRLDWLGSWMARYGEALHDTRPWHHAEGETRQGAPVRFTRGHDRVYAVVLGSTETNAVTLENVPGGAVRVELLGHGPVDAMREGDDLHVSLPPGQPAAPAFALAIEGLS